MSNVSIYEKNWTELVFEDRNKAYGAYQLRQENSRTTLLALLSGILLLIALMGSWMLLSSFGAKAEVNPLTEDDFIVKVTDFKLPLKDPEETKAVIPLKKSEETKKIDKEDLINPTIVKPEDNPDELRTNKEVKENPNNTSNHTDGGATTGIASPGTDTGKPSLDTGKPAAPVGPVTTNMLDKLPEYPGGIKKFYEYVGISIEKSEINDSSSSVSVIMGFVIEKDGSMTDIKVLRSSDKALEREAIRVLKALRIKWAPGFLNGEKVRTQYTLPIKVAI